MRLYLRRAAFLGKLHLITKSAGQVGEVMRVSYTRAELLPSSGPAVSLEEALRAQMYRLLAGFLGAPAEDARLRAAAELEGDDSALGVAVSDLAKAARAADPVVIAEEFNDLFIGLGRGALIPYCSYYLTGFLHEKPLAVLRQDMSRLGVARDPAVHEPEDHIATLCETMAGLIDGRFGVPLPLIEQKAFYAAHIGSWAPDFFGDLQAARQSDLYSALGAVGKAFLEIEKEAFEWV